MGDAENEPMAPREGAFGFFEHFDVVSRAKAAKVT